MSRRSRWVLVAVVLAVAGAVAFWPRSAPSAPAQPAADLTALRAKAKLDACPKPTGTGAGPAKLAGIKVECLGDGTPVDLAAVLAGRSAVLEFWEPWCPPCRDELPALEQYAAEPGAVMVLTIEVPDESDDASGLDMLAGLNVHLPAVFDRTGAVAKALAKPNAFPISYVVDADGTANRVTSPGVLETPDQVRHAVQQYRSSTPPADLRDRSSTPQAGLRDGNGVVSG